MEKAYRLILESLSLAYEEFVLYPLNTEIVQGERIAIMGDSGAGKSTVLKLIQNMECNEGQVSGGIEIHGKTPQICTIFQEPRSVLNPLKSIEKLFKQLEKSETFPSRVRMDTKHILRYLDLMGFLDDMEHDANKLQVFLNKRVHQISGGMAQRVMIGMALAMQPDILLVDEATSSLDEETEDLVIQVLMREVETILMVTHRLHLVQKYFDRIIFIDNGECIYDGTKKAFLQSDNERVKDYIENLLLAE